MSDRQRYTLFIEKANEMGISSISLAFLFNLPLSPRSTDTASSLRAGLGVPVPVPRGNPPSVVAAAFVGCPSVRVFGCRPVCRRAAGLLRSTPQWSIGCIPPHAPPPDGEGGRRAHSRRVLCNSGSLWWRIRGPDAMR